jgi:hypothetical protein
MVPRPKEFIEVIKNARWIFERIATTESGLGSYSECLWSGTRIN